MMVDKPFAVALLSLAVVYSVITVVTYRHVAAITTTSEPRAAAAAAQSLDNGPLSTPFDRTGATLTAQLAQSDDPIRVLRNTFPLHVTDDTRMADLEHPGTPYRKADRWNRMADELGHPPPDPVLHGVPQFYDHAYGRVYSPQTGRVRDALGDHGRRLMTVEEAASIGSFARGGLETVYVAVASYRDPECAATVSDLYERAEFPHRIRVAIVEQRLPTDDGIVCHRPTRSCDEDPAQALCKFAHLLDYYEMDAHLGVGPVFARHLAGRHYRGEYYAMQIDSHVRFTRHWDSDIIGQWKSAKNESTW